LSGFLPFLGGIVKYGTLCVVLKNMQNQFLENEGIKTINTPLPTLKKTFRGMTFVHKGFIYSQEKEYRVTQSGAELLLLLDFSKLLAKVKLLKSPVMFCGPTPWTILD
jgi:hypothetical protein